MERVPVIITYNAKHEPIAVERYIEGQQGQRAGFADWGWNDKAKAEFAAKALGPEYGMADEGPHVSPRYSVFRFPTVGEEVSYGFNGDSYPCGKIVAITDSKRKITTKGEDGRTYIFWRLRESGTWKHNRTWSLMRGTHNERNPEF